MKWSILVLLAFSALIVSAQSEISENEFDEDQFRASVFTKLFRKAKNLIENGEKETLAKINDVLDKLKDVKNNILNLAKSAPEEAANAIRKKINKLTEPGGAWKVCGEKYLPNVNEIIEDLTGQVGECVSDGIIRSIEVEEEYNKEKDNILNKVKDIKDSTEGCSHKSILKKISCINIANIIKDVARIGEEGLKIVGFVTTEALKINDNVMTCVTPQVDVEAQTASVVAKITSCALIS